jgi:hypothetical protein
MPTKSTDTNEFISSLVNPVVTEGSGGSADGSETKSDTKQGETKSDTKETKSGSDETKPETKRKADDGEDVDVDENERVTMTFAQFQKRLKQAQRAVLRGTFESDDVQKIRKDWEKSQAALKELNEIKKSRMDEVERAKKEAEEAKLQLAELENSVKERELNDLANRGEQEVLNVAKKFIHSDYIEDAVLLFQGHLGKLSEAELEQLTPESVNSWFKDYVKRRPALAVSSGEKSDKPQPRPINSGAAPNKPNSDDKSALAKTPRPGQPNSMTRAEWDDFKRRNGLDY